MRPGGGGGGKGGLTMKFSNFFQNVHELFVSLSRALTISDFMGKNW